MIFGVNKRIKLVRGVSLGAFIIVLIASCKKDKVPINCLGEENEECDCIPLPPHESGIFDQYIPDSTYYLWPQFNPNDDNEILYVDANYPGNQKQLYKFNLITHQKTLIYEGAIIYEPSWGAEDWILLNLLDFQIWKIKSDGSGLMQVTSNGSWFHPEWNLAGDRFIAYHGYVDVGNHYPAVVWDGYGAIVDSFDWSPTVGCWRHPQYYGGIINDQMVVIEPYTNQIISNLKSDPNKSFNSFNWISESNAIVTNVDGIYDYNVYSQQLTKLRCSCSSKWYIGGSTNSDNSKIIYGLSLLTRLDGQTVHEDREIVIMNTDGTDEQVIEIPE